MKENKKKNLNHPDATGGTNYGRHAQENSTKRRDARVTDGAHETPRETRTGVTCEGGNGDHIS